MAYIPKTNWKLDDTVMPDDMNRIEQGVAGNKEAITEVNSSLNTEIAERKSTMWNPNILDNWDFRNPINQRSLQEYIGVPVGYMIYCIDRWRLQKEQEIGLSSLKISTNCIEIISPSEGNTVFEQSIEFPEQYEDLPLTFSLKVSPQNQGTGYISVFSNNGEEYESIIHRKITAQDTGKIIHASGIGKNTMKDLRVRILVVAGTTIKCESVKLELGKVSTLVNDPPQDYGTELAKCQRYLNINNNNGILVYQCDFGNNGVLCFYIPLPVSSRNLHLINIVNAAKLKVCKTKSTPPDFSENGFIVNAYIRGNCVLVEALKVNHGLDFDKAILMIEPGGGFSFEL